MNKSSAKPEEAACSAGQVKELTDLIESVQAQLFEKIKEVDGKRKENSKEIKALKHKLDQKANKD